MGLTINKIILCSDQHIRLFKRHAEYEQVFKRFYKYIDSVKDENTVIVLGGDLVHNKIEMTPELIRMSSNFLKECADRCPTILILGNHDFSPNAQRLDALTPIVDSLNHPNLHFWKNSGVYKFGGINWSVFSLLGNQDEWISASDIKGSLPKIAIFHGPVLSNDYTNPFLEEGSRTIKSDIFNGFDMVMLGDIHISNQTIQTYQVKDNIKYPAIKYPGSLICQSFGETPNGHGVLLWDVKTRTSEFIEIDNDYCYYTLDIINNVYNIPKKLPKKVRLRVRHENSNQDIINEALERFATKYNIVELTKHKKTATTSNVNNNFQLGNSRNTDYQNQLIDEYFKNQLDGETISAIKDINVQFNKSLLTNTIFRNITWKPKMLEFSNMFSYGENNSFDFTDLSGTYSISAKNFEGKSAFLEILCFALYDKSVRATKAIHVLNNNKTNFYCKFSFEFNGQEYFIERIGTKNEKNNTVRVDVNFWTTSEDGEIISLNGEDRDNTNKAIREYVGTYDDFVMTALSTQYDNQSFVEKTQRERKDLLYKFLDINIYDDLYKLAKEHTKEQQTIIKIFEKEDLYDKSSKLNQEIQANEITLAKIHDELEQNKIYIKDNNLSISDLNKQLQKTDITIQIDDIEQQLQKNKNDVQTLIDEIKINKNQVKEYEAEINSLEQQLSTIDINQFVNDKQLETKLKNINDEIILSEKQLHDYQLQCVSHERKIKQLESHEYDPNCQYCIKNQFVTDAKQSVDKLIEIEYIINQLQPDIQLLHHDKEKIDELILQRSKMLTKISNLATLQSKRDILQEKIKSANYKGQALNEKIKTLEDNKIKYYHNESIILKNEQLEQSILKYKTALLKYEELGDRLQKMYRTLFGTLSSQKSDYNTIQDKLQQYNEIVKNNRIYELYIQALGRDGIPYLILEKILPLIEFEVNEILSQTVDFTVRLESTEEKYIHAFIDYGNNQTWPVELTSGMERFILSLAFRTSLTEITSLPRAAFLAIDEGFGVLDTDNLLSMGKLFEFLKTRYNYLLVISHIDSMKDLVEKRINVQKINGYSTISIEEN